jgi:hypothetical protein
MVTAGDAKITADLSTPLVVYKSWEREGARVDREEAAGRPAHRGQPRPEPGAGRGGRRWRLARGTTLPAPRSAGYRLQRPGQRRGAGERPRTA